MAREKATSIPLKLSQPAHRALSNAGITTFKQLTKYTEKEIAALHGIGKNVIVAIKQALKENGLSFLAGE